MVEYFPLLQTKVFNCTSISFLEKQVSFSHCIWSITPGACTFKVINALKKLNKVTLFFRCCGIPAFIRREKPGLYIHIIDTLTKHSRTSQLYSASGMLTNCWGVWTSQL